MDERSMGRSGWDGSRSSATGLRWLFALALLVTPTAAFADDYEWLHRPFSDRSNERAIGTVSSLVDVFPDKPPAAADLAPELTLSAARNESESGQVVLIAGDEPLSINDVTVSDLRGGQRVLSSEHLEVRLVGYVDIQNPSWRSIGRRGLYPDPLMRFRPFTCPPGQARSLWVTVSVPEDASAGMYRGALTLHHDDGGEEQVPIVVRVFNFTLPEAPQFHTSYWSHFSGTYDVESEGDILDEMIRMFGSYRVSTSVAQPGDVKFYYEADGSITCDWDAMRRRLELAVESGFRTLNVGPGVQGVHGDAAIQNTRRVLDRETGEPVSSEVAASLSADDMVAAYLVPLADWLEERDLLDRAYIQIRDEEMNQQAWFTEFQPYVERMRRVEPRIALLSVLGLHPITQGWFDIYAPHTGFHNKEAYEMVRTGVSLRGEKNFPADVTASSTGGWSNASFYKYDPNDAYDGSHYTKWIPATAPTSDEPQWLEFQFEEPVELDGMALTPYGSPDQDVQWYLEGSQDGETFEPINLRVRGDSHEYAFDRNTWKAMRITWTRGDRAFVSTAHQYVPPPEPLTAGLRQVEFLGEGLPREATLPRDSIRPAKMMWEYNVDADFPGAAADNRPIEARLVAWQSWIRGLQGYLNYGGGQWALTRTERVVDPDTWVYPTSTNGSAAIVYAGPDEVLPSIRLARLRDGVDDYDYLVLMKERWPNHRLLAELRQRGLEVCRTPGTLIPNRELMGNTLGR
ncbi:discoidin domain-containing protein [Phycisphaerales bacterium AB-hyl4]|uniref:Discoidin domain-containing protein n=1 Tax=Natronomicrosphaera hydrolytica TaxID=3242702 RepID=A0ABV4UAC4_9BACT